MHIDIPDSGYRYAEDIRSCASDVVYNHPLGTNILAPNVLSNLKVKIDLHPPPHVGSQIQIDCETSYPQIILHFCPIEYEEAGWFDKELFMTHLYHEFTHCIDRWNPCFGYTKEKKENAQKELGQWGRILVDLWNLYVDGRLYRKVI